MAELDIVGQDPAKRADAVRNRRRILAAASDIVAGSGVENLSMNAVAAAAGVGVGTVYRRFGDLATLIHALIDDRERDFQAAFLTGPAPLGPGAPPPERIRTFLHTLAERTDDQLDLLLAAESATPFARFGGAYTAYRDHLAMLIGQVQPGSDARYLADALLAPLAANLVSHQTRHEGMTLDRIREGIDDLLGGLFKI